MRKLTNRFTSSAVSVIIPTVMFVSGLLSLISTPQKSLASRPPDSDEPTFVGVSDTDPEFFKAHNDKIRPNLALPPGRHLNSSDDRYILDMQEDGNLVLYKYDRGLVNRQATWASNTNGKTVNWAVMQAADGRFVLYSGSEAVWSLKPKKADNIPQIKYLTLQDDGNVVVYDIYNNAISAIGIQDQVKKGEEGNKGWLGCPDSNSKDEKENKNLRRFPRKEIYQNPSYPDGVSNLLCGKQDRPEIKYSGYGWRHIVQRHQTHWRAETLSVENLTQPTQFYLWQDIADYGTESALAEPDSVSYGKKDGKIDKRKICFSRKIDIHKLNGQVDHSTIVTVIIRMSDGAIITAYPNSKHQCRDNESSED